LEEFIALLYLDNSIAPFIRHVSIKARNNADRRVRVLDCVAALRAISDMAPAFKSISLHYNSDSLFRHLSKCLRVNELTALTLQSCLFHSTYEWIHFLSEFSLLQQLYMSRTVIAGQPMATDEPVSLPNLRELEIYSRMMAVPYLSPPSTLSALHFRIDSSSDFAVFGVFMDKIVAKSASHLERLSLHSGELLESCFGTFLCKYG
jgi:hypothetical protein